MGLFRLFLLLRKSYSLTCHFRHLILQLPLGAPLPTSSLITPLRKQLPMPRWPFSRLQNRFDVIFYSSVFHTFLLPLVVALSWAFRLLWRSAPLVTQLRQRIPTRRWLQRYPCTTTLTARGAFATCRSNWRLLSSSIWSRACVRPARPPADSLPIPPRRDVSRLLNRGSFIGCMSRFSCSRRQDPYPAEPCVHASARSAEVRV